MAREKPVGDLIGLAEPLPRSAPGIAETGMARLSSNPDDIAVRPAM
jgi:hypothetical protein